jgi:hypothetical protein
MFLSCYAYQRWDHFPVIECLPSTRMALSATPYCQTNKKSGSTFKAVKHDETELYSNGSQAWL